MQQNSLYEKIFNIGDIEDFQQLNAQVKSILIGAVLNYSMSACNTPSAVAISSKGTIRFVAVLIFNIRHILDMQQLNPLSKLEANNEGSTVDNSRWRPLIFNTKPIELSRILFQMSEDQKPGCRPNLYYINDNYIYNNVYILLYSTPENYTQVKESGWQTILSSTQIFFLLLE